MVKYNYPNMMGEVIDAISNTYKDHPEVELDCMKFLQNIAINELRACEQLDKWFEEKGICELCGAKLETYSYEEPHTEFSPVEYETLVDVYCPNCDGPFMGSDWS